VEARPYFVDLVVWVGGDQCMSRPRTESKSPVKLMQLDELLRGVKKKTFGCMALHRFGRTPLPTLVACKLLLYVTIKSCYTGRGY
jgi:hypothetical protein